MITGFKISRQRVWKTKTIDIEKGSKQPSFDLFAFLELEKYLHSTTTGNWSFTKISFIQVHKYSTVDNLVEDSSFRTQVRSCAWYTVLGRFCFWLSLKIRPFSSLGLNFANIVFVFSVPCENNQKINTNKKIYIPSFHHFVRFSLFDNCLATGLLPIIRSISLIIDGVSLCTTWKTKNESVISQVHAILMVWMQNIIDPQPIISPILFRIQTLYA